MSHVTAPTRHTSKIYRKVNPIRTLTGLRLGYNKQLLCMNIQLYSSPVYLRVSILLCHAFIYCIASSVQARRYVLCYALRGEGTLLTSTIRCNFEGFSRNPRPLWEAIQCLHPRKTCDYRVSPPR